MPDLGSCADGARLYINQGDGFFTEVVRPECDEVVPLDADGDGRIDLFHRTPSVPGQPGEILLNTTAR